MAFDANDEGKIFADSDDEDLKRVAKVESVAESDPLKGCLRFKSSKSSNASLYYVDHSKLPNNGNGLAPLARNELTAAVQKTQAEAEALQDILKTTQSEIVKFLSEPTNEEAMARLEKEEVELKNLEEEVEGSRKFKTNEKHKKNLKHRIDTMTSIWRKRRRMCTDFLISMEENTEGTITAKKCLSGDGPIEIDSDEAVAKAAKAYYLSKKNRPMLGAGQKKRVVAKTSKPESQGQDFLATESFVAVTLNASGCPERVYAQLETK
jgi:hypothetical protein